MKSDNNPLNIRFTKSNKWLGQIGQNKGFIKFLSMSYGVRAAIILLKNYFEKYHLDTIEKIISRYAPSSENDTQAYISYVSSMTNIPRDRKISLETILYDVLPSMAVFESHYFLSDDFVEYVICRYKIKLYEKD